MIEDVIGVLGTVHKDLGKKMTGGIGNQWKNRQHTDINNVKIVSPGELRRFAVI